MTVRQKTISTRSDMLVFEPGTKGHHLSWLRYVTEDFLAAGFTVTWAIDGRDQSMTLIQSQLSDLIDKIGIVSVFDDRGRWKGNSKVKAIAQCLSESGAAEVFLNNLDEVASHMLRCSAIGWTPPPILKGRLSGVYFRPRFLQNPQWPIGNLIKAAGFRRLVRYRWFRHLFILDEYLLSEIRRQWPAGVFHYLPDPWAGDYLLDKAMSRSELRVPDGKLIFLIYGIGERRKGLHILIRVFLRLPSNSPFFLLCAGQIGEDREIMAGLSRLENEGRARVINRYVSDREEALCFSACDVVMLPYIHHFGSSGVLSRSSAAGKMVIVSDEFLLGRRVRDHHLGWLVPSGDSLELERIIRRVASLSESDFRSYREAALLYAKGCSREAFRKALLKPFVHEIPDRQPFRTGAPLMGASR